MLKSTRPLGKVAFVLIASLLLLPRLQVFAADIGVDANCTLAQAITAAQVIFAQHFFYYFFSIMKFMSQKWTMAT